MFSLWAWLFDSGLSSSLQNKLLSDIVVFIPAPSEQCSIWIRFHCLPLCVWSGRPVCVSDLRSFLLQRSQSAAAVRLSVGGHRMDLRYTNTHIYMIWILILVVEVMLLCCSQVLSASAGTSRPWSVTSRSAASGCAGVTWRPPCASWVSRDTDSSAEWPSASSEKVSVSLQGTFVFSLMRWSPLTLANGVTAPGWASAMGWTLTLSSVSLLPVCALYTLMNTPGNLQQVKNSALPCLNLSRQISLQGWSPPKVGNLTLYI